MTDKMADERPVLWVYGTMIRANGERLVTWTCERCEARHIDDHEVAPHAVRCCACGVEHRTSEDVSDAEIRARQAARTGPPCTCLADAGWGTPRRSCERHP